MASNWLHQRYQYEWRMVTRYNTHRTVMGMELRSSLSNSTFCTCFLRSTKWLLSISWASEDNRGAHFLGWSGTSVTTKDLSHRNARFAVRDISLHPVNVDFSNDISVFVRTIVWAVHVDIHDMFCDHLQEYEFSAYLHRKAKKVPGLAVHCVHPW